MKWGLVAIITVATALLVFLAWLQSGGLREHSIASARSPEEAVQALMSEIQAHDYQKAYASLDRSSDTDLASFIRDVAGSDGSLRTYSSLETADVTPLHADPDQALVRLQMKWSSALGSRHDVRDLRVRRDSSTNGSVWRVVWPKPDFSTVPPQVVPVNYLRWEVIGRNTSQNWGAQDVDSPKVRITSMNAIARPGRVVILGEVENEDTVPAYLNVNATLLKADGSPIEDEGSFDLISHVLLPKQVSPYRIDFPGVRMDAVKSVRMDARALLVPASADPVIAVSDQAVSRDKNGLDRTVLKGELVNQSGRPVNIAQVLAAYYDDSGKVIWVADDYVDQALMPQVPVPFAVDIPDDIAGRLKNYRVVVNHYSRLSN
ncbi:MAG: FxLYD domain-containing protein [Acidobacteriia bacterium]|nr:FxLYD domain-containing protein [Terriglobia bacterium]